MSGLQVEHLAAFRGDRLVFEDLSFAVPRGGALLLTGPNGAGKSTLLRILAGLGRAEAGRVMWAGAALGDLAERGAVLAYVGHLDAIKSGLTAVENAGPAGLEAFGLAALADVPARLLSAGQRRRLALSRLLGPVRPLWLLDEPTLGLDAAAVERFGAVLRAHRAAGGVVIAATHLPLPLDGAATLALS